MLVLKLGSPISSDVLGRAQTLDTGMQVLHQILHADETPGQQTGESHGWQLSPPLKQVYTRRVYLDILG